MEALRLTVDVPRRAFRVDLELAVGRETVALVGPSGAGKTTVLRAISGLTRPERGRIELDGAVLFDSDTGIDVAPEHRRVGFVFQDYALFPHMTVEQNVALRRARTAWETCSSGSGSRSSRERKAGVALGRRAAACRSRPRARPRPGVLLLDEPLSALDAHTRAAVRGGAARAAGEL